MEQHIPTGQRSTLKGYSLAAGGPSERPAPPIAADRAPRSNNRPATGPRAGNQNDAADEDAPSHFDSWFKTSSLVVQSVTGNGTASQQPAAAPEISRNARNGRGNRIVPRTAQRSQPEAAPLSEGKHEGVAQQGGKSKRKRDPDAVPGEMQTCLRNGQGRAEFQNTWCLSSNDRCRVRTFVYSISAFEVLGDYRVRNATSMGHSETPFQSVRV